MCRKVKVKHENTKYLGTYFFENILTFLQISYQALPCPLLMQNPLTLMGTDILRKGNRAMLTDLYQLTMAQVYFMEGRASVPAAFYMHYRRPPVRGCDFVIAAGMQDFVETLREFHFSVDDIQYLGSVKSSSGKNLFTESFLNHLQRFHLSCTIKSAPEGTPVFPFMPLVTVEGPLLQAQLLETITLNLISFPSLVATQAMMITESAAGGKILEFGLRRAQGMDGGLSASRAAYIGGIHATSNVLAGKLYGIPVKGTHAHSFILSHVTEKEAFESYALHMPDDCTLLVDTYNNTDGIRAAVEVGKTMYSHGKKLGGIRLDSGNLSELSKMARYWLDEAGLRHTKIVASGDLDASSIKELVESGAPIDIWGVGTALTTVPEKPSLGGVYKLGAIQHQKGVWQYKTKHAVSGDKKHWPGLPGWIRTSDGELKDLETMCKTSKLTSRHWHDLVYNQLSAPDSMKQHPDNALVTIMNKGELIASTESLHDARERCRKAAEALRQPNPGFPVLMETSYADICGMTT